jgi:hypothetical protein
MEFGQMYRLLTATMIGLAAASAGVPAVAAPIVEAEIISGSATQTMTVAPGGGGSLVASHSFLAASQYMGIFVSFGSLVGPRSTELDLSALVQGNDRNNKTLTIELTETDVSVADLDTFSSGYDWFAHNTSTLAFDTYYDLADTPFGTSNALLTSTTTGKPPFPDFFNIGPVTSTRSLSTLFSLTEVFVLTPKSSTNLSLDGTLAVEAPEPTSLVILGGSLVALGLINRRRKH